MLGNEPVQLSTGLQQLKNEHPSLLAKIDGLLDICTKVENSENKDEIFKTLRPAVEEFFAELAPHSEREEGVLFEMMAVYIGRETGPIAVMEYEHDQAKTLIGTFLEHTEQGYDSYTVEKMIEHAGLVKQASYTLIDHFSKEENILFPMAEKMLTDQEKEDLLKRIQ
ncbi:hemerythrin domain-containing protein [Bacillus sp. B15-48]|nr:hemerythrin domain-containing protein [Bacillus sp. B15-48]